MNPNTNMTDIINAADKVAAQNDRWLMVACLIIIGIIAVCIWRWMVSDREKLSERLTVITDRHIAFSEKLTEVVSNNTNALSNNTDALNEVSAVMRGCKGQNDSR